MNKQKKDESDSQDASSHTMGLRLDDVVYQKLDKLSKEMNMKKSQLLKHALMMWANQRDSTQKEDMIVIGKSIFKQILNEMSHEKAQEYGRIQGETMAGIIRMRLIERNEVVSIEKFMEMNNRIFVKGAFGWFDSISHKLKDGFLQIFGLHSLDKNFSIFVEELLGVLISDLFGYNLEKERSETKNNMINLFFPLNMNV